METVLALYYSLESRVKRFEAENGDVGYTLNDCLHSGCSDVRKHSLTIIANAQVIACTRDNERRRMNFSIVALIEQLVSFTGEGRVCRRANRSIDRGHRRTLGPKAAEEQPHTCFTCPSELLVIPDRPGNRGVDRKRI